MSISVVDRPAGVRQLFPTGRRAVMCSCGAVLAAVLVAMAAIAGEPGRLAYTVTVGGESQLQLHELASGDTVQLTFFGPADPGVIGSVSAPAAGDRVFFTRPAPGRGRDRAAAWQVYADGGGLTLREDITPDPAVDYRHLAVSPGGGRFAYTADSPGVPGVYNLYTVREGGVDRRRLNLPYGLPGGHECAWPVFIDDDHLLFRLRTGPDVGGRYDFYRVRVDGTGLTSLTADANDRLPHPPRLGRPTLNRDRTRAVFALQEQAADGYEDWAVYELNLLTGARARAGAFLYQEFAAPIDQPDPAPALVPGPAGNRLALAAATSAAPLDIYLAPLGALDANPYQQRLTRAAGAGLPLYLPPSLPRGRFLGVDAAGRLALADAGVPGRRLLSPPGARHPALCPRGRLAAHVFNDTLRVTCIAGGGTRELVRAHGLGWPVFTPDGRWLVYVRGETGIHAVPLEAAAATAAELLAHDAPVEDLALSADGRRLVFTVREGASRHLHVLGLHVVEPVPPAPARLLADGPARAISPAGADDFQPAFGHEPGRLYFVSRVGGRDGLWSMNRDGSGRRPLAFDVLPTNPQFPRPAPDDSGRLAFLDGTPPRLRLAVPGRQGLVSWWLDDPAPATAGRFDWRRRPAERSAAERLAPLDVFDAALPLRYALEFVPGEEGGVAALVYERLPAVLAPGDLAGTTPPPAAVLPNDPPGATTVKWVFGPAGAPRRDTVIRLRVDLSAAGLNPGDRVPLDGEVLADDRRVVTAGPGGLLVGDPWLPLDLNRDWRVDDGELLLAISHWASGRPLDGWPGDDESLLEVISFWVAGGYHYDHAASALADVPRWAPDP